MSLLGLLAVALAPFSPQEPAPQAAPTPPARVVAQSEIVLTRFALDAKQTLLATLSGEHQLALWGLRDDKLRWGDAVDQVGFPSIEVAITDKLVVGGCAQATYRALRLKDAQNEVTRALPDMNGAMTCAAIDLDLRWLWFGSESPALVRCELATIGPGRSIEAGHGGSTALVLTPSGDLLAVAGRDASIRFVDARTAEFDAKRVLLGHEGPALALAFDAKANLLASGGEDKTVRLWTASNGKPKQTFVGHAAAVRALAFDPKSQLLASGDDSGLVKVWRVSSGEVVAELANEVRGPVTDLEFIDKGKSLLGACGVKGLLLWDLSKL